MTRKWIKPWDLFLFLIFLAAGLLTCLLLRPGQTGDTVEVYRDGTCIERVTLSSLETPIFRTLTCNGGTLTVLFEREGVSVTHADCPDGVCVRTGRITERGESIVCVPLGVYVAFAEAGTLDGVTG